MSKVENFENLDHKETLLKIINAFECATEFNAVILDIEGRQIIPGDCSNCVSFCEIVQNAHGGKAKCQTSYKNAGIQALKYAEPYIFMCHAGILAFAAPLMIDEKYAGIIICRNILMWEPDDFFFEELREKNRNLDIVALEESVSKLKIVSSNKVHAAASLLYLVANQVINSDNETKKHKKEIMYHQSVLNQEIKEKKRLHQELIDSNEKMYGQYKLQNEKELLGKIAILDRDGAYQALLGCMSDIMKKYFSRLDLFKTMVLELMIMISRTVVETGAEMSDVIILNTKVINEIYNLDNEAEIGSWVCIILNKYMDLLEGKQTSIKTKQIVDSATEYIRANVRKNITLLDVADAVFVSQYYLSHVFREVLECTVVEYITKVKIETAKKLLHNPKNSVADVSEKLGFGDTSYFSKVFKKNEGITPTQFRKRLL